MLAGYSWGTAPGGAIRRLEAVGALLTNDAAASRLYTGSPRWNTIADVTSSVARPGAAVDVDLLYRQHSTFLLRAIRGLSGEGPHVDDILQETFVAACRQWTSFEGRSAPRTWLYGIARNLCRKHFRGLALLRRLEERWSARPAPAMATGSPEREAVLAEEVRLGRQALGRLSLKQREVFVLFEIEGLEGPEIAEVLGLPLGTVWTRLAHARRRFQKALRKLGVREAG